MQEVDQSTHTRPHHDRLIVLLCVLMAALAALALWIGWQTSIFREHTDVLVGMVSLLALACGVAAAAATSSGRLLIVIACVLATYNTCAAFGEVWGSDDGGYVIVAYIVFLPLVVAVSLLAGVWVWAAANSARSDP